MSSFCEVDQRYLSECELQAPSMMVDLDRVVATVDCFSHCWRPFRLAIRAFSGANKYGVRPRATIAFLALGVWGRPLAIRSRGRCRLNDCFPSKRASSSWSANHRAGYWQILSSDLQRSRLHASKRASVYQLSGGDFQRAPHCAGETPHGPASTKPFKSLDRGILAVTTEE